jgi:hypothetical protein
LKKMTMICNHVKSALKVKRPIHNPYYFQNGCVLLTLAKKSIKKYFDWCFF